jgi:spore germination protein YaaH
MAYDEHWSTGLTIGSVASQPWYEQNLANRMREIDPAKTIVALGNYGYEWVDGPGHGKETSFQEAGDRLQAIPKRTSLSIRPPAIHISNLTKKMTPITPSGFWMR